MTKTNQINPKDWFNSLIEVLKEDNPHLESDIDKNIETLERTFNTFCETDLGKALNETIKELHKLELATIDKFTFLTVNEINTMINILKSDLIKHKLDNNGEQNLGRILLETRLEQYELTKEKIKQKLDTQNQLTGFTCNLHPDTVKQIFNSMVISKQISGDPNDFQAIFANAQAQVKNPVKWLIKSQKKPYRGHQIKLYLFIETMLNGKFSAENKRKAVDLFIDEKGKFFNPEMKEPKEYERLKNNIFENLIKQAKEKTPPA